ncbi:MAG: hypothetical protein AAGH38_02845, partial [Pseudomonadota bacterium]
GRLRGAPALGTDESCGSEPAPKTVASAEEILEHTIKNRVDPNEEHHDRYAKINQHHDETVAGDARGWKRLAQDSFRWLSQHPFCSL